MEQIRLFVTHTVFSLSRHLHVLVVFMTNLEEDFLESCDSHTVRTELQLL